MSVYADDLDDEELSTSDLKIYIQMVEYLSYT